MTKHLFPIGALASAVCAALIIAFVPAESLAQGSPQTAAPPVAVGACPPGLTAVGKKCVKFKKCPADQHAEGETCKPCPPNHKLVGKECQKISIHTGKQVKASDLLPEKCPTGQHPKGKTCVKDAQVKAGDLLPDKCPTGQHYNGKACVKN